MFIQNQTGPHPNKWDKSGFIVEVRGNDQYLVKVDGTGRLTLRNRRFIRQFTLPEPIHAHDSFITQSIPSGQSQSAKSTYSCTLDGEHTAPYASDVEDDERNVEKPSGDENLRILPISSDGGHEFTSSDTKDFLKRWAINHSFFCPIPQSNVLAEVAVKKSQAIPFILHWYFRCVCGEGGVMWYQWCVNGGGVLNWLTAVSIDVFARK